MYVVVEESNDQTHTVKSAIGPFADYITANTYAIYAKDLLSNVTDCGYRKCTYSVKILTPPLDIL